jgi:hypothetical protein
LNPKKDSSRPVPIFKEIINKEKERENPFLSPNSLPLFPETYEF